MLDERTTDPRRIIAELRRARDEALEQQAAIAEVLKAISRSAGDLDAILRTVVTSAARLCRADQGAIYRNVNGVFRWCSGHSLAPEYERIERDIVIEPGRGTLVGRAAVEGRTVQIEDAWTDPLYEAKEEARVGGIHSMLGVPVLRDGTVIGVIGLARRRIEPYSDREVQLVATFADQAVIAIENARLLTELRNRSDELARRETALRTSDERYGLVTEAVAEGIYEWDINSNGLWVSPRLVEIFGLKHRELGAGHWNALVHPNDFESYRAALRDCFKGVAPQLDCEYRVRHGGGGYRWIEDRGVPVRNAEGRAVRMVGALTDVTERKEREREVREALEQQTATAEVLRVISGSTTDVQPVFDAIVTSAANLCDAEFAAVARFEDGLLHLVAVNNLSPQEAEAFHALFPREPGRHFVMGRAFIDCQATQVPDVLTDPDYDQRTREVLQRATGYRTFLGIPILRDGVPIGVIGCARRQVKPFSAAQIQLIETFADQAVIAIENVRLFVETREALEQQTATAEVLQVINSSPGDLAPVFDAILEKAHTLCGATHGHLTIYDGTNFRAVATHAIPEPFARLLRQPFQPGLSLGERLINGELVIYIDDLAALTPAPDDRIGRAVVELGHARTLLAVPLRRDDRLLGYITAHREEVRPFTDKQIALLQNFASQAVIAMENARLLNEIRQRQAELRVTFDNMGDGVAMFDAGLRLAAWNRNFQQMLDLPDAFLETRPSFAEYFDYLAKRGEYGSVEVEVRLRHQIEEIGRELRYERTRPDGRIVEIRRNPVPGGGFVLIYSDVTEQKRAEAEIRAARDAAETALADLKTAQASLLHAQKMAALGQLTAGIAHEIKNPLNFVNNFASLSIDLLGELKEMAAPALGSLDADTRADIDETIDMLSGNLEKIAEHGKRADNIVKSMLAHSRGSSGERQAVDLNALVDEALNLAYHGARAHDQNFNITMERDFDKSLAPVELVPQDVMRVFLNLIGNGFHAAHQRRQDAADPGFRPVLKVATRDLGDAVEVRVRDNGTGIRPEHRDKLFQPFFTTKPAGEGTGLGLSISYDIVTQEHGGTITVDSEPGMFTEFTVRLPRSGRRRAGTPRATGAATGRAA